MTNDAPLLKRALEIAEGCHDIEWYGVGCVIADQNGRILSTGFTGELKDESGKGRHAEDVAIQKAADLHVDLNNAILYSTLEPCSIRASGKTPCVQRILSTGIKAVVYGAKEPFDAALNIVCDGDAQLKAAGIDVRFFNQLEAECLKSVVSKRQKT